jgi:hypothetical protein
MDPQWEVATGGVSSLGLGRVESWPAVEGGRVAWHTPVGAGGERGGDNGGGSREEEDQGRIMKVGREGFDGLIISLLSHLIAGSPVIDSCIFIILLLLIGGSFEAPHEAT